MAKQSKEAFSCQPSGKKMKVSSWITFLILRWSVEIKNAKDPTKLRITFYVSRFHILIDIYEERQTGSFLKTGNSKIASLVPVIFAIL